MVTSKLATIDIGSNSLLLLAGHKDESGRFIEILNESEVTGLGRQIQVNSLFSEEAMDETIRVLINFKEKLQKIGFTKLDIEKNVLAYATEASRRSLNSKVFFQKIKNDIGFDIQIISSEGEAYYSSLGVMLDTKLINLLKNENELLIMDIGGASTEIIWIEKEPFKFVKSISFNLGSVTSFEWLQKSGEFFQEQFDKSINVFEKELKENKTKKLICIAGTMTSVASLMLGNKEFLESSISGYHFSTSSFEKFFENLEKNSEEALSEKFPYLGKRVKTLKSGALIGLLIAKILDIEENYISTKGARYGVMLEGKISEKFILKAK
jgi:exopolyphosphatase/guanosine-5'-triphosphate,3'-diphosphate pyrophosphatase